MPILKIRETIYISTWNVRIMCEIGRNNQIAEEMKRCNLMVFGISENYRTEPKQQRIDSREILLYSNHGEENSSCKQRVALILLPEAQKHL